MSGTITEKIYAVNQIKLNVAEAGIAQDPVILFLHGFPEYSYAWHKQLPFFAQNGFRAVAPDQRGYNLSSKPQGVKAYKIEDLVSDIVGLIKTLSTEKIILVGHDWGGAIAWRLAREYPELLHKLIILNMPHPHVMRKNLRQNPRQMLKSWYAGFFQIPWLPEILSSAFHYKILKRAIFKTALPQTFSPADIQHYLAAWRQPDALTAMINWYRAFKYSSPSTNVPIEVPTLLIWGKKDAFLGSELAAPSIAQCRHGELFFIPETTHWLHHEQPQEINKIIMDFVTSGRHK